jgi:transposase
MTRQSKKPVVFERQAVLIDLKQYLCSLKGRTVVTVEETTTAQWLYLELRDEVDRIIICDPLHNRWLCHGPKTDRIDADKLCILLRSGLLKEVFHSADELYELRSLVSAYEDVVRSGVRALNQQSALERGHRDQGKNASFILEHLHKNIDIYRETKEHYEAKFEYLARHNKLAKSLLPISGIGTIGAVKIVATVIDAKRFATRGHFLSYCGLVKHEKLSGGRSYGRRMPRYSHTLKAVYKTAAMAALRGKNPIREYYDYLLGKGIAEHNARHAVARYIARITYGILKTGTRYDPYRWRKIVTKELVA